MALTASSSPLPPFLLRSFFVLHGSSEFKKKPTRSRARKKKRTTSQFSYITKHSDSRWARRLRISYDHIICDLVAFIRPRTECRLTQAPHPTCQSLDEKASLGSLKSWIAPRCLFSVSLSACSRPQCSLPIVQSQSVAKTPLPWLILNSNVSFVAPSLISGMCLIISSSSQTLTVTSLQAVPSSSKSLLTTNNLSLLSLRSLTCIVPIRSDFISTERERGSLLGCSNSNFQLAITLSVRMGSLRWPPVHGCPLAVRRHTHGVYVTSGS